MSSQLILLITLAVLTTVIIAQEKQEVTGIAGKSVTLKCNLPRTTPPQIKWVDWVHNTGRNAQLIFDSTVSPEKTIYANHPNRDSMAVEDDFSLRISQLKFGDNVVSDSGEYICISTQDDGSELEQPFMVNIGGLPECSGRTELSEGETSLLSCVTPFSGNAPSLSWYMGDQELQSLDMNDIGKAKREYTIAGANHEQDGKTFTCKMMYAGFTEECSLLVSVTYTVRDLKILPESDSIEVNQEVKCSALGNPKPVIDLKITTEGDADVPVMDGNNYKAFKIGKELEGQQLTVSCTATNTINGQTETLNKKTTYTVVAPPTTTTTTTVKTTVEVKTLPPVKPEDKDHKEPPPTPKPDANKPGQKNSGGNTAGIIAGVIIAALVIVVIVIAVVCIRRKNSKKHKGAKPVPKKKKVPTATLR